MCNFADNIIWGRWNQCMQESYATIQQIKYTADILGGTEKTLNTITTE